MNYENRPTNLHPETWRRVNLAARCAGSPPPPIVETISRRFRSQHEALTDGQILNEVHEEEPYSAIFAARQISESSYTGETLTHFGIGLIHLGIVMYAPVVQRPYQFALMIGIDTNLPLPDKAVKSVIRFLTWLETDGDCSYQWQWAREIPRQAIPRLLDKIHDGLCFPACD